VLVYFKGFIKYRSLLNEFVVRDIKTKYRRSYLGLFWTLLNPLLTMSVMAFVFSHMFRMNILHFPVYLLAGQTIFSFYTEATTNAMHSIIASSSLIKKIYMPKYLFPLSKTLSCMVSLVASFIALLAVMLVTGVPVKPSCFLAILPMIYIFLFSFGIGLVLSSISVFFRDIVHFYGVLTTLLMYLTPMFYPFEALPNIAKSFVQLNPLTNIVEYMRVVTLYGSVPPLSLNVICLIPGVVSIAVGALVFFRNQYKFILYI